MPAQDKPAQDHLNDLDRPGLQTVEAGEFAGWKILPRDTFDWNAAGPFYSRRLPDRAIIVAFKAEKKHLNDLGLVHGGVLMTFADHAMFHIATDALKDSDWNVTATFNAEFLGPAREGETVIARGEVTRSGGSMVFVRGLLHAGDQPCLSFSGALRKGRYKKS